MILSNKERRNKATKEAIKALTAGGYAALIIGGGDVFTTLAQSIQSLLLFFLSVPMVIWIFYELEEKFPTQD